MQGSEVVWEVVRAEIWRVEWAVAVQGLMKLIRYNPSTPIVAFGVLFPVRIGHSSVSQALEVVERVQDCDFPRVLGALVHIAFLSL